MLLKEVRYFIDKLYLVVMGKTLHRIISKVMTAMSLLVVIVLVASCSSSNSDVAKERMQKMYGENKKLTSLPDSKPSVICSNGTFVGVDSNGVKSFKGIPYAVQPSKLGRWKPSQLAPADSGILRHTISESLQFSLMQILSYLLSIRKVRIVFISMCGQVTE